MATFNPQSVIGKAAQGAIGLPVIIGLPSDVNPAPNFVIGVTTKERARGSSQITGMPITDGDLIMKSARNPGKFSFDLILSEQPAAKSQQIVQISKIVNQLANLGNVVFGSASPASIAGATASYVTSQLMALQAMKDGFQPIFAVNLYMPLSAFSINSSLLSSSWYIEDIDYDKQESERGVTVSITLKELLSKASFASKSSIIQNFASAILGPGVGSAIGGLL